MGYVNVFANLPLPLRQHTYKYKSQCMHTQELIWGNGNFNGLPQRERARKKHSSRIEVVISDFDNSGRTYFLSLPFRVVVPVFPAVPIDLFCIVVVRHKGCKGSSAFHSAAASPTNHNKDLLPILPRHRRDLSIAP